MSSLLTRAAVLRELELLCRDAALRIARDHGLGVVEMRMISRDASEAVTRSASTLSARRMLAQLWCVLSAVHAGLLGGKKMTQRELWYRLKTTSLFQGPPQVSERVLDVCAAVSCRSGLPCPREALGIVSAPRGSMTGCVTVVLGGGGEQPLDNGAIFEVPGDTEEIRALRFSNTSRRALCLLVIEKDSVFRRLIDDKFVENFVPCVLVTACGFPDLATRALVGRVAEALRLSAYAITDYNPHGIARYLTYR